MKYQTGISSEDYCEKGGYSCLRDRKTGIVYVVPTRCRVWSCLGCRDRNLAAVRLRIQFGCSMVKVSSLITLTYVRRGPETLITGRVARGHLSHWWLMFRDLYPGIQWFQVPEMTRRKQVHFHNVVGGLPDGVLLACERGPSYGREWCERSCLCLEHRLSALWHRATGTSFVVDARPVVSATGAARYLGKYLTKGLVHRQGLHRRGFVRRWSCSRNWPRPELRMRGTVEGRWQRITHVAGGYANEGLEAQVAFSSAARLVERVGSAEAMAFDREIRRLGAVKRLERFLE